MGGKGQERRKKEREGGNIMGTIRKHNGNPRNENWNLQGT